MPAHAPTAKRAVSPLLVVWLLAGLLVVAPLAGCAGGGGLERARAARYQGPWEEMLETVLETVRASYEVIDLDPHQGRIVTKKRWYEVDRSTDTTWREDDPWERVQNNSIRLHYVVTLRVAEGDRYRVEVEPIAVQSRSGYSAKIPLTLDDPSTPGWVHGKTEKLAVAIDEALTRYRAKTAGN